MAAHISPFAEVQDIGGLLNINGFNMLTIVSEVCVKSFSLKLLECDCVNWH